MAKKSFTANPALDFISPESIAKVDGKQGRSKGKTASTGTKRAPIQAEPKSKRVQLLVQPSVYEAVRTKAEAQGISVNEAINEALRKYTER